MATQALAFEVGKQYTYSQVIDDKLVRNFADVTGDHNPIHVDEEFAKKTKFGRRIAHGAILFGIISRVLAEKMPGPGTVYLSQLINFKLPVFIDDTVTLEVQIAELLPKNGAKISTVLKKQTGEVVADGEATVKLPMPPKP
jgi:3-hydroxybutyryl-CoA dehydratase